MKRTAFISLLMLTLALACASCAEAKVTQYKLKVVKEYEHDPSAYTQGLFFMDGILYESTGQYGESSFRKVDLQTGKVERKLDFNSKYFIEGSVELNGTIYVLTWTNKVAFLYDAQTLKYKATWSYPRSGWGLTTDGKRLIASDGSSRLYFLDDRLQQQKVITVKMNGRPMSMLNELEWIDGKIWANVYMTDMILIINPDSGEVEGNIDCTGLLPDRLRDANTDVLNGIAVNDGKIYLTGKYWKRLYEVELVKK